MNRSYWDTSAILADAVRLPCHVVRDCSGLAHLQGSVDTSAGVSASSSSSAHAKTSGSKDDEEQRGVLKKNTRIDVPFWLAELLALHGVVDFSVPRQYASRVRNALDADAKSVQLQQLNSWWYAIGVRLAALMEAGEFLSVLQKTYAARIAQIFSSGQHLAASSNLWSAGQNGNDLTTQSNDNMDSLGGHAAISMSAETIDFIHGLEESEAYLLRRAQDSVALMQAYLASGQ